MKISPIRNIGSNLPGQSQTTENINSVNFNAKLKVLNDARNAVPAETFDRFTKVMDSFKNKLVEDTNYPDEVVELGESVSKSFIPTEFGHEKANLKLSVNDFTADFFYNVKCTVDEIARDLYNTYKYISHIKHSQIKHEEPSIFVADSNPIGEMAVNH